jgi:hypothetical protein
MLIGILNGIICWFVSHNIIITLCMFYFSTGFYYFFKTALQLQCSTWRLFQNTVLFWPIGFLVLPLLGILVGIISFIKELKHQRNTENDDNVFCGHECLIPTRRALEMVGCSECPTKEGCLDKKQNKPDTTSVLQYFAAFFTSYNLNCQNIMRIKFELL